MLESYGWDHNGEATISERTMSPTGLSRMRFTALQKKKQKKPLERGGGAFHCFCPRALETLVTPLNKTFLFVYQSSRYFSYATREDSLSITFLSDFGYLESFRRYSRPKSKVVKNRAEFWLTRWIFSQVLNFHDQTFLGGPSSPSAAFNLRNETRTPTDAAVSCCF